MIYIFDKDTLAIKQMAKVSTFAVNLDEETNGKSTFSIKKEVSIKKGDFAFFQKQYFLIDEVTDERNENTLKLTCKDIAHLFDRKILDINTEDMQTKGIEIFIKETIEREFKQLDDNVLKIDFIDVVVKTTTQANEPTNSEQMAYNFKTFLANCRQNKNIFTTFEIVRGDVNTLLVTIENKQDGYLLVDATLNDVTGYKKVYEVEPVVKCECFCANTSNVITMYLRSDFKTTYDKSDPLRIRGLCEVTTVEEETDAEDTLFGVFRANRYKHLVEFKISKKSKLVDVEKLQIGTPIIIKTHGVDGFDIYESYISAKTFDDSEFVSFKSGNIRVTLTDRLAQLNNE